MREDEHLNIHAFSKELGCSHGFITKVESGDYDDPSPLNLAKVIEKYDLDLNEMVQVLDTVDFSEHYLNEVKRLLYRNVGTKIVINKKNIISKLKKEYLDPNGYCEIQESDMKGKIKINQSTFGSFNINNIDFKELQEGKTLDDFIKQGEATIYPSCLDYVCIKENRLLFVKILDITSTIAVNVDKIKIEKDLFSVLTNIFDEYIDVDGKRMEYDVLLVTPSEKILVYTNSMLNNLELTYRGYKIGIALVRPKRPIIPPNFTNYNDRKYMLTTN
ncbi:MAG: helix-turn-helix domain-containing protein [Erysipelotrichaceae bacterium]|nr:helix-turn-helix domain-containing protein [Erysipelotrichaceae bacterium]